MVRYTVGRSWTVAIAVVSAAIVVSCSGQPSTPGSPSAITPAAPPSSVSRSTISGTVLGVTSATQIRPENARIIVTVTGTSAAATVDDGGRFTLTNVPAGRVDLHFSGTGIDAHLALDVAERSTLVIVVRLSGNDARLENDRSGPNPGTDHQEGAEVNGVINAGSLTGSCAVQNRAFTVGATRVVTNRATAFRDGTCESLVAGTRVEAKGTRQADGSLLAVSVERKDADDDEDDEGEVELKGAIVAGSISGACASNSLSFRIASTQVKTNAATRFKDTACTSLKAGDSVEVKGLRQADASVLATRVERKK